MDEQRRLARLQTREQGVQARERLHAGERARGQRHADAAAIEQASMSAGSGASSASAPHTPKGSPSASAPSW